MTNRKIFVAMFLCLVILQLEFVILEKSLSRDVLKITISSEVSKDIKNHLYNIGYIESKRNEISHILKKNKKCESIFLNVYQSRYLVEHQLEIYCNDRSEGFSNRDELAEKVRLSIDSYPGLKNSMIKLNDYKAFSDLQGADYKLLFLSLLFSILVIFSIGVSSSGLRK